MSRPSNTLRAALVVTAASATLAGCASRSGGVARVSLTERECMARVMYFESNRSSDAGMLAVGTVVMNRLNSGRHGSTVCQVVGQRNQFAPGVLSRPMTDSGKPRAFRMADTVLGGARHPAAKDSLFFHTYGYRYPYNNMRYTLVAGGNAFYEKRQPPKGWFGGEGRWPGPPTPSERVMIAHAEPYNDRSLSTTPHEVVAASVGPAPVIRERPVVIEERVAVARKAQPEPFDIASNGVDQPMPAGGPDAIPEYEPLPSGVRVEPRNSASRYERLAQADVQRPTVVSRPAAPQVEPARIAPARYERLAQADLPRAAAPRPAAVVPVYEPAPAPRYERVARAEPTPAAEPLGEWRDAPRASRPVAEPIEARPLPPPVVARAPARVATRAMNQDYDTPRAAAPARRETPQELGWNAGPQGVPIDDVPQDYVPSVPAPRALGEGFDEPTGATKLRGKDRIVRGY